MALSANIILFHCNRRAIGVFFRAICSMWATEGVWKRSVVIRMDMEAKVEEEEAVAMATALVWRMA